MAYDPALLSFILVGLVGGVAVVMNVSTGWESSHELSRATDGWTAPLVVRRYPNDATARTRIAGEASVLEAHDYRAVHRRLDGDDPGSPGDDPPGGPNPKVGEPAGGQIVITYHLS